MKKSIIALIISSTLFIAACNDKEEIKITQQTQNSEQTVSQVENQTTFPALQAQKVVVFKKEENLTFPKSQNEDEYSISEARLGYDISTVNTNIKWLNDLLLQRISQYFLPNNETLPAGEPQNILLDLINKSYQRDLATLKEGETIGIENNVKINYVGQRNNLVTFNISNYLYLGGAHGSGSTNYLNIDNTTRKILTLDDIVTKPNRAKLKELVWRAYLDYNNQPDVSKTEFHLADNFYFSPQGISFVYQPYDIGSYAEGEITLSVPWYELENILNNAYLW